MYFNPEPSSRRSAHEDFERKSLVADTEPPQNYAKLGEFDDLGLEMLATYCRWVSKSQNVSPEFVVEALSHIAEWSSLISTPGARIADTEALRARMALFLARTNVATGADQR